MQLPFSQQLVLLLIDKLILGAIAILIGLLARQFLERYKARQTLLVEISKARLSRFTDLLERFEKLRKRCDAFAYHLRIESKEQFLQQVNVRQDLDAGFSFGGNIRGSVLVDRERLKGYRHEYNRIFLDALTSKRAEHDRLIEQLNLFRDELISSRSLLGAALDTVNANYWALREWLARFLEIDYQYKVDRDVHRSDEWTHVFEPMESALLRSFKDPNEPGQSPP